MPENNGYYCCWDHSGPYLFEYYTTCLQCNRIPCGNCFQVYIPPEQKPAAIQQVIAQANGYRSPQQQVAMAVFGPSTYFNTNTTQLQCSLPATALGESSGRGQSAILASRKKDTVVHEHVNRDTELVTCCACFGSTGVKDIQTQCTSCYHMYCPNCPTEWTK